MTGENEEAEGSEISRGPEYAEDEEAVEQKPALALWLTLEAAGRVLMYPRPRSTGNTDLGGYRKGLRAGFLVMRGNPKWNRAK
jgi:hypothetical protein